MHTILLSNEELTIVLTALYALGSDPNVEVEGLDKLVLRLEEEEARHERVA